MAHFQEEHENGNGNNLGYISMILILRLSRDH